MQKSSLSNKFAITHEDYTGTTNTGGGIYVGVSNIISVVVYGGGSEITGEYLANGYLIVKDKNGNILPNFTVNYAVYKYTNF